MTAKSAQAVFGVADSVKTIALSNGQVIKLSKGHGIIQFPEIGQGHSFTLEGIAGRKAGTLLPGFMEVYNFREGDVFQFYFKWMSYGVGYGGEGYTKQRILSRDSTAGGYTYSVERYRKWWSLSLIGSPGPVYHEYQITTSVYTGSADHACNHYPGQLVEDPLGTGSPGQEVAIMTIRRDTGQTISRYVGVPGYGLLYRAGGDTLAPMMNSFVNEFTTGLGNVSYSDDGFEWSNHDDLIGYIRNGDTTGVICRDDFLLEDVVPAPALPGELLVYPNPARDRVFIMVPGNKAESVVLELFAYDGRIVRREEVQHAAEVVSFDVSGVAPGVYMLRVGAAGGAVCWKIVVSN